MLIRTPKSWEIPEREATPESVYWNRREALRAAGFAGAAALLGAAPRNAKYTVDSPITEEWAATGYNNYYEFHPTDKQAVKDLVGKFKPSPWKFKVSGLVDKPGTLDLDDVLKKVSLEERVYRFRCVEAWSMVVPWTGFPMSDLFKLVQPKPQAKYVRFVTVSRPDEMPGMKMAPWYKWPYYEGLRMDEAMNPMAMFVTGIYGKPLPTQNGAPIRAIVPWKYGYKSPKSLELIEFMADQPKTFWNDSQPAEYGFYSNVNPGRPHPRWSQASERVIPRGDRPATLMYNGYASEVAALYKGDEF
jgi:sulfoxide reductase catalytic subunit YedY